MAVPEQIRTRLSDWCSSHVPAAEREQWQVGYTIQGEEITILDRRPPAYPELGSAWTSTPLAQLRLDGGEAGGWVLYRPVGEGGWRQERTGPDPIALLEQVRD